MLSLTDIGLQVNGLLLSGRGKNGKNLVGHFFYVFIDIVMFGTKYVF